MDEETVSERTPSFSPVQSIRVFLNDCSLLLLRGLGVSLCRFSEVSDIPKPNGHWVRLKIRMSKFKHSVPLGSSCSIGFLFLCC